MRSALYSICTTRLALIVLICTFALPTASHYNHIRAQTYVLAQLEPDPGPELEDIRPDTLPDSLGTDDTDSQSDTELDETNKNENAEAEGPDYAKMTREQERSVRLDILFERLKSAQSEDSAKLIAEEIWVFWADSGSASINFLLSRGIDYEKEGQTLKARRMYDQVTKLAPEYAEGWARSARLAFSEADYERALVESAQTLVLEPREFYALWTLGNVLERIGQSEQALDIYKEALALYPLHPALNARVNEMSDDLDGSVL